MKKINIFGAVLALVSLVFVACSDDVTYVPGTLTSGEGYYFSGDGSATVDFPSDQTSVAIPIYRMQTATAATVTVAATVTYTDDKGNVSDASSLFDIQTTASFAAGESVSAITIGYDPDQLGYDTFDFYLSLTATGETTPYGLAEYSFVGGVPEPWISLGMATFYDYFFFYDPYEVELQQNELYPTRYRLVLPYQEGLENPDEGYTDYAPFHPDEYLTFQLLQPGDVLAGTTITSEGLVYFDPYDPGWFYDYYSSDVVLYHPSAFSVWPDESDWAYSKVVSYAADGATPTTVQLAPIYYLPDYGGYWDCHDDGYVVIVFPGGDFVETDYSVNVAYKGTYTDTGDTTYAIAGITLGEDVASAEVAMAAGNDATSLLYGILYGTVATQKVTSDDNVVFPLDESGQYTILAVSYDAKGEAQEYNYTIFTYYASSSENPWESLGYAEYTDDCITTFFAMYEEGDLAVPYDVEIQENTAQPGLYRLVNPYGEAYPFNDPGDWDTTQDYYMEVNACDPDGVYIEAFDTGCDWGYGDFLICSLAAYWMENGYSLEEEKMYGDCGTLNNGVITFPIEGMCIGMANYYGGAWFSANLWGNHKIVLPSARSTSSHKSKSVRKANGTKQFRTPVKRAMLGGGSRTVATSHNSSAKKTAAGINARPTRLLTK